MIIGIFRSRLRETGTEDYPAVAERMVELVARVPGFRGIKSFAAEDGERVSIFEFESLAALDSWKRDAEHLVAQRRGREEFYESYELQICQPLRTSHFQRD
ncbi:MAG: antibiotic biosynthesis monooxygenase [Deltaproteobacteria bacterium]|jgi:heme-degrading monooxygenase HmoA|nr:antibiotic biosynthesis monooxygenase [Deltaproteobacteria bacterium]